MDNYILDGHTPVVEPDVMKWARWFEDASQDHGKGRRVAETTIYTGKSKRDLIWVSTVFLGTDMSHGMGGPPLLFETMVFPKGRYADMALPNHLDAPTHSFPHVDIFTQFFLAFDRDEAREIKLTSLQERYATWEEAEIGHKRVCAFVHALLDAQME